MNAVLALFETHKPTTADEIMELCEASEQYLLLSRDKGTFHACGMAALEQQGMSPNQCSDEEIKQAAVKYMKDHGGKRTSFGYLIREADSPWAKPGKPQREEPYIHVVVKNRLGVDDEITFPIDDPFILRCHHFTEQSKFKEHFFDHYFICSHQELLPFAQGEYNILALNRAAQYIRDMDPLHFDRLLEMLPQMKERGAQALMDTAVAAEQEFINPSQGGMQYFSQ